MGNESHLCELEQSSAKLILKQFTIFSVISVLVILILSGTGMYRINYQYIISDAEKSARGIAYAIFEREKELLLAVNKDNKPVIAVKKENFEILDERMKKYLPPLNMYKIKFFNTDKRIVYSTDHSIIDKFDNKNIALNIALGGRIISKIVKKGSVTDLDGETKFNIDVVETYLPIKDRGGSIIGSFEVYVDITDSYAEIKNVVGYSVAVLLAVLVLVFGVLYWLMSRATNQLTMAQDELQVAAIIDGLTRIYNRRYLIKRSEEEFNKVKRKKSSELAFIILDIDHFKRINDTYGHQAGDQILKEVAERMKNATREYDVVGRYGGEEFLIVVPDAALEEVMSVAERIWTIIRESPFKINGGVCNITISLGIARTSREDGDVSSVINRADQGLYKAKQQGRDRIVCV